MSPNSDNISYEDTKKPSLTSGFKRIPKYRSRLENKYGSKWLEALKDEDGIFPYWRIHNKLYDLSDFICKHPGGKFWLEVTQGLDITEAFESCHYSDNPNYICKKYFVKDIFTERTSPFTFEENGFYKTLKRKASPIIEKVKSGPSTAMKLIQDSLFVTFISLTIWGCLAKSYYVMCLAGIFLTFTANCAHNFFHQKDNLRMYMFDFSLLSSTEWRFTHVLLHHIFPNTIHDFEAFAIEPFMKFRGSKHKNIYQRYLAWSPINVFTVFGTLFEYIRRGVLFLMGKMEFQYTYLIQPAMLIVMTLLTQSFTQALCFWLTLHTTFNLVFLWIALSAAHHHQDSFMEGDRYIENRDWGILQIATVVERKSVPTSLFLTAIAFGHHTLHHLFPTVDHSKLSYLVEPFLETCEEFGVDFEFYSEWEIFKGYFWRLANVKPNLKVLKKFRNAFT